MARKAFIMCSDQGRDGDNLVVILAVTVFDSAAGLVVNPGFPDGTTSFVVEMDYSTTLLSLKADAQAKVTAIYGTPAPAFVWLDAKGLL